MDALPIGSHLQQGRYTIERMLGSGGYGITYLCKIHQSMSGNLGDITTVSKVCIKEFFPSKICKRQSCQVVCTGDRDDFSLFRKQFRKEAKNISTFSHPHIVKVADVFDENGTTYYVMQYLEGGSLSQLVERQGALDTSTAISSVLQIADALTYLHDKKHICHLDVKPGNIMIDEHGQMQLIDFGISKHYHFKDNKETTDMPIGISPGYAPLEQYDGQMHEFSPETDIYSLSATLYHLLTGKTPPTAVQISSQPSLLSRPAVIPPGLWTIISKGMAQQREHRYHSAKAFAEALHYQGRNTTREEPKGSLTRIDTHKRGLSLTTKALIAIAFLFMFVAGIFIAKALTGKKDTPSTSAPTSAIRPEADKEPVNRKVKDKRFVDENGDGYTYTGPTLSGKPHGKGVARSDNGWVYEGPFVNGRREGKNARLTYRNKNVFRGEVVDKLRQIGVVTTPDGRRFEGELHKWKPYLGFWYERGSAKPYVRILYGREVAL